MAAGRLQDSASSPAVVRGETGLGEWYGSAPFEHPIPASPEVLETFFPALLSPEYEPAVVPTRMGETIDELHDRVATTMDALISECDRDGVRAVLLCSHAAVVIALGRVLTGDMPENVEVEDFRAFTCGLSVYRRRRKSSTVTVSKTGGQQQQEQQQGPGSSTSARNADPPIKHKPSWRGGRGVSGGWDCDMNSDCSHLSGGEERGW